MLPACLSSNPTRLEQLLVFNMSHTLDDFIETISEHDTPPILPIKSLKRCHILTPDLSKPMGAVVYKDGYYSYVMSYTKKDAAQRGARRLLQKGNKVVLTTAPRRLILWVLEPDAKRVWSA